MADEKPKNNIRALSEFRLKGKVIQKDEVISKEEFAKKADWQNLCNMQPKPRAEETSDVVGKAKKADDKGGLPGAGK